MPKFLNNIDLNGNQLLSPVIHVSSQSTETNGPAGNTTGTEGQIFYNSHAKALFYRDDAAWRPVGDITGVTFTTDDSTTISDTAGSAAFTIAGGAGITTSSTGSTITIVTSNDQDTTGNAATVTTNANLTGHVTSSGNAAVLGSFTLSQLNTAISDGTVGTQTLPTDFVSAASGGTFGGNVTVGTNSLTAGSFVIGGHTIDDIDITSEFVDADAHIMSSKAIGARFALKNADTTGNAATVTTNANLSGHITSVGNTASLGSFTTAQLNAAISDGSINSQTLPTDFVSAASGGTFSGNVSFGDNDVTNVDIIYLDEIKANDAASITIGNEASKQVNLGRANTVDGNGDPTDPSVETPVVVRGSLNVNGKLTVAGDFETTSTSNTIIKDKIIQLNSGATGANSADFGFVFNRGSETNVAFRWDESELNFDLIATASSADSGTINPYDPNSDGESAAGSTNWQNFRAAGISAVTGFSGNGASITALNGSNISSGTVAVAYGGTGISNFANSTHKNSNTTKTDVGLANVENTALSTYTGQSGALDNQYIANGANYITSSANITGTAAGLSATLAVASGGTGATSLDGAGIVEKSGAQTIGGVKTFTGGLVLDDGSGAAPIIKWINQDDDEFTIFNNGSGKLKFQQKLVGLTATNEATLDENGLDVDSGLSIGGNAVHATDTSTSLGTSDTVVPSQNAVKTYVDSQSSSSGNTGGRNAFSLANAGSVAATNSGKTFTITHGMGDSLNYGVEVIRAANGSGETVYTDVTRTTTTIVINFAVAPTSADYTALVCKY